MENKLNQARTVIIKVILIKKMEIDRNDVQTVPIKVILIEIVIFHLYYVVCTC